MAHADARAAGAGLVARPARQPGIAGRLHGLGAAWRYGVVSLPALRLEAGGWRLEAGGWRLEAGGWRLEAGQRSITSELIKLFLPASRCFIVPLPASSAFIGFSVNRPATAPAGFESAAAEDRHPPAATTRSCAPAGRAAGRPTGRPARGVRRLHRSFPASAPWDAVGALRAAPPGRHGRLPAARRPARGASEPRPRSAGRPAPRYARYRNAAALPPECRVGHWVAAASHGSPPRSRCRQRRSPPARLPAPAGCAPRRNRDRP